MVHNIVVKLHYLGLGDWVAVDRHGDDGYKRCEFEEEAHLESMKELLYSFTR